MLVTGYRPRAVRAGPHDRRPNGCRGPRAVASLCAVESTGSLLAARLAAGDERALAEAFDLAGAAVHATAVHVLGDAAAAQDVVQDVFLELWRQPQRFHPDLGSLRTYLCLCARHRAQDLVRSQLRRARRELRSQLLEPPPQELPPEDRVVDADSARAVRAAVRRLTPDQQEVVELAYFRGLSYRDVARVIGVPEGTAKSRVRLALAKLETLLDRRLLERP